MDKYKKLATNTVIFAIGTFSSKVLSFLLMPFVTRVMGTGDYGSADLVQQTGNVLIPIVFLQVFSAVLRYALDKNVDKKDVFTVGIRTVLKGYVVFLLFWYPISLITINDFDLGEYIVYIYVFVLTSGCRQLCQNFVRGCGYVRIFAVDGILATATMLAFNLLFLGPLKLGVGGYISAIIASDFCSVIFLFVTCKLWRYVKFRGVRQDVKKEMIRYAIPMMPTVILWWIVNVSDRYMVTAFISSSANGLYTAASKIPNFVVMFSTIFIDAWQLSAVDEYDSDSCGEFFSNVMRVYSGGIFVVAAGLIFGCQIITRILVSSSYYDSWQYVPVLIIATSFSCFVNFLGSIYMAEKKSVMAMVTALVGAGTNVALNLILIPRIGAVGAAIATVIAFIVVFILRAVHTRKYIKLNINISMLIVQTALLIAQCAVMLIFKEGLTMYAVEAVLLVLMAVLNIKPIKQLCELIITRFFKKSKQKSE